jgi:uncharacterized LabA/DUF88 family protein
MLSGQRIGVLVDGENLEIYAEQVYGERIDYRRLLDAVNGREVVRALYYKPARRIGLSFRRFIEALGVEVKTPPKNVDCWLSIDAVTLAEKCDVIVLVGGDGDYAPLLWFLKSRGVRVEVWMWAGATAEELRVAADAYVPLTMDFLLDRESRNQYAAAG